jgi:hypothetical protein
MKIRALFTGSAGGSPALNAERSPLQIRNPNPKSDIELGVAAASADGVFLTLSAQRSNGSAADPAAVRGATRSPMSA